MLPCLSCAIDPIQRKVESGLYVPCWYTDVALAGLRTSYQRTAVGPLLWMVPTCTECVTTTLSYVPKLRYARRNIRRSASESSFCVTPDCGMHVPPLQAAAYDAT